MSVSIHFNDVSLMEKQKRRASDFVEQHEAQHLDNAQLIQRTAAHLMAFADMSEDIAHELALHVVAEAHAKRVPAFLDVNNSTSYVVRVMDPQNRKAYAFTASELVKLARSIEAPAIDSAYAIQTCGRHALGD
jgi:hypothetical protein